MNRQTITFSANEQGLQKTGGITHYASDTISYIDAIFTLGENWNGFDEVRAIFKTPYTCNFAVLNSEGECTVPLEALVNKGSVRVNLVGSIYTEEAVVDRLTTHSVEALIIDEDVPVCGSESAPLEPSEYEQFVAKVANDANRAEAGASDAETSAQNAKTSEDNAKASETLAQTYEAHAQTYAQNAHNSATSAETAKDEAEDARDEIRSMTATATTLAEGSQATASYSNGVLSLGIPRGDKGNKGDTGASAGFGTVTASVDDTIGTPSVEVTTSGSDTAKNFAFAFHNLKGEKGDKGDTGEVSLAMLNAMFASALPTDTASGSIASFPDGTDILPAISVLDSIEPIQDLHGYDKPWSGGNGANKWDEEWEVGHIAGGVPQASTNAIRSKNFCKCDAGATYYVTCGKNDGGTDNRYYLCIFFYDENQAYITGSYAYCNNQTVTAPANAKYFKICTNTSTVIYGNTYHNDICVNNPSSVTTYSPYTNICPISGRTEVVTSRCGENLFDKTTLQNGYIDNADGQKKGQTASIGYKCTDWIRVDGGNQYYVITTQTASILGAWYDENKTFLSGITNYANAVITAPQNAHYCRLTVCRNDNGSADTFSINYPSTDHDYHAYNGTSYTTDLGQTVYGGTLDVVSGVLTVDRGYIASYNGETLPSTWISDRDEYASGTTPTIGAEVVYELTTPQTIQLTPQEVDLILGTNNLWCDSGNIEVNYYADIQKYIDKKLS